MVSAAGLTTIVRLLDVTVIGGTAESVTCTVNEAVAALAGGVPEMVPVTKSSVNPKGRDPAFRPHALYGAVPPVAASVAEYGLPMVAAGSVVVVIERVGAVTVMLRFAKPTAPVESCTRTESG
jgi:hypothetical protein